MIAAMQECFPLTRNLQLEIFGIGGFGVYPSGNVGDGLLRELLALVGHAGFMQVLDLLYQQTCGGIARHYDVLVLVAAAQ